MLTILGIIALVIASPFIVMGLLIIAGIACSWAADDYDPSLELMRADYEKRSMRQ